MSARCAGPRANLFSSPLNALLTLVSLWLLWIRCRRSSAGRCSTRDFAGTTREACRRRRRVLGVHQGALPQFLYGLYPAAERWRVDLGFAAR